MPDTLSDKGGQFSKILKLAANIFNWMLFVFVGIAFSILLTSPAYAWWFSTPLPQATFAPLHQQGLVLSPIYQPSASQLILQPLVVPTAPPTATPTPTPTTTPTPRPTIKPTATPAPVAAQAPARYTSMAEHILALVNQQRSANGLPALTLNASLTKAAQSYAEQMQSTGYFAHTSKDGTTFKQRDEAAGYTNWVWLGENIAYGQQAAEDVMSAWMNSAEHKANILNAQAKELGVGYAGAGTPYWVQDFGASD
jgi:uncharacterized protein YkwD